MNAAQQTILNKIEEYNTIIIHRHVNPDPDAYGSQGGLQKAIQFTYPEKEVYVVGEEVEGLKFLNKMDEVEESVYEGALVIVTDTANEERISDQRFNQGEFLIKIDHHPNREPYGDVEWVDESYSSASEMLTDLIRESEGKLKMNHDAAHLFYAGLIGDTGRFLYNNTKSRTFDVASLLLSYGVEPTKIYNEMYKTSRKVAKFQGYILQNFEVTENGVAHLYISRKMVNDFDISQVEAANLVNTLANIEGNHVWVFFVEYDNEVRVRIRSKEVTINEVARQFDGGGHPLASGATVHSVEESQKLIDTLDELVKKEMLKTV